MMNKTVDDLLVDLTHAAISYGEGLQEGNSKKANKASKKVVKVFEALQAHNAQDQVLGLLEFAHPAVRLVAAGLVLPFAPERGEAVLRALDKGPPGPIAAMAYTNLCVWKGKILAA